MQKVQTGKAAIKYAPAITLGYGYGLGVWIRDKDASGAGTTIFCPGVYGTYPLVDFCRGYAALIFVKTLQGEQKRNYTIRLKMRWISRLAAASSEGRVVSGKW